MEIEAALRLTPEDACLIDTVSDFTARLSQTLGSLAVSAGVEQDPQYLQSLNNINSIGNILKIRAAEISARWKDPMAWVCHDLDKLKQNFVAVFDAIQQNSKGAYRIIGNIADQESDDYFVSFEISSISNKFLWMPAVFQDVVRDFNLFQA